MGDNQFISTNTADVQITYIMNKTPRPTTVDWRKNGTEGLFEYLAEYANKNCEGRLATALIEIVREHKDLNTNHPIIVSRGGVKMAEL